MKAHQKDKDDKWGVGKQRNTDWITIRITTSKQKEETDVTKSGSTDLTENMQVVESL